MEAQKPTQPAARPAAPKAKKPANSGSNVRGIKNAFMVIVACFVVAVILFLFVFGWSSHFEFEGDYTGSMWFAPDDLKYHPVDLIGTVFKGGVIVPVLQTLLLTVLVLSVERAIALKSAKGTGSIAKFVAAVKAALAKNDIAAAKNLCDRQKGSVAAVVRAALNRYEEMDKNTVLTKEQKITTLQKEVEEATAIEMPSLQQNLPIVATLTTLGTLVGLLGTVIGMIKSFQALSASGAPDSTELSTGISEALINTAFGIATGAFAVISYNFYTNKIDNLTYAIDEIGFSIVQSFAATH